MKRHYHGPFCRHFFYFTTIASFISSIDEEIVELIRNVFIECDEIGLIDKEMFVKDGCKLVMSPWSGIRVVFEKKCARIKSPSSPSIFVV
ncbi:hypothetical protein [Desulfovulcanus sp.]